MIVRWQGPPDADPSAPPAPPATTQPAEPAAAQPAPPAPDEPASAWVNAMLDNLLATGNRIADLPLFMIFGGVACFGAIALGLIALLCRGGRRPRLRRLLRVLVALLAVLAVAVAVDHKLVGIQRQLGDIRDRMSRDAMSRLASPGVGQGASRQAWLFDLPAARADIERQFGSAQVLPTACDDATDVVQIRLADPLVKCWLAVIDLAHPGLEICLGTNVDRKSLTSRFARDNGCSVAINGEAGRSPDANSGFGEWIGNLIDRGKPILLQDSDKRPFLAFSRENRATYSPAAVVDREVTPEKFNCIWGRIDAIVGGQVITADSRNRQPRTTMGIDREGRRLYLLVADGRQPGHSIGLTRAEVGRLMAAFGAHDGMLCDEGGSSCIYLAALGGIANTPSDNHGQERPTYTHFGVRLAPPPGQ
ncbi:MAG: hypothetical protein BIFFINMI_01089 [Phycisphaerae bacterium]|nr:hypothetical protein [Phycisphaerae bacterium]